MLKRLLESKSKTIISAAIILGAASLVSRVLGIFRDRVLAAQFGAGIELDMYYAAFRIPDLIFNLLVLGALSAGFIPIYTDYLENRKKANDLANVTVNVMIVGLLIISVLGVVLAPWLVKLIAPGFEPTEIETTVDLTRIMFLSPILLSVSGVLGSILQAHKRFLMYSLSPIFYNVGIIVGAIYLAPQYGLVGLGWGVALGSLLHLITVLPAVFQLGYRYRFVIDLTHSGLRKILTMMVPRTMTLLIYQLNFTIVTIIGSLLAAGSIAVFNFANNIQSFPLGIFGVSIAIAAFPTLSELHENKRRFIDTFSQTVRQMLFLIVPSSVLLIVLRAQIVRILLGSGQFSWDDTRMTLMALTMFSISLFAQALILLFARAFYALRDSKTPFYTGLASAFSNVILAMIFSEVLGVAGLALAFSLSNILNLVLLFLLLQYRLGALNTRKIAFSVVKISIASFVMALVAQAAKYPIEAAMGTETFVALAIQGSVALVLGGFAYLAISWLLGSEELTQIVGSFRRKLSKPSIVEDKIETEIPS